MPNLVFDLIRLLLFNDALHKFGSRNTCFVLLWVGLQYVIVVIPSHTHFYDFF